MTAATSGRRPPGWKSVISARYRFTDCCVHLGNERCPAGGRKRIYERQTETLLHANASTTARSIDVMPRRSAAAARGCRHPPRTGPGEDLGRSPRRRTACSRRIPEHSRGHSPVEREVSALLVAPPPPLIPDSITVDTAQCQPRPPYARDRGRYKMCGGIGDLSSSRRARKPATCRERASDTPRGRR